MNRDKLVRLLASFFYCGYLPWAPGAWGSIPGALIAWYFSDSLVVWVVVLTALGFILCVPAQKAFNAHDPIRFVLDEVCGMMLTLVWLPKRLSVFLAGYVLFRILDVWKPWPISYFNRSDRSSNIMWDDLVAAIFANLILQVFTRFGYL